MTSSNFTSATAWTKKIKKEYKVSRAALIIDHHFSWALTDCGGCIFSAFTTFLLWLIQGRPFIYYLSQCGTEQKIIHHEVRTPENTTGSCFLLHCCFFLWPPAAPPLTDLESRPRSEHKALPGGKWRGKKDQRGRKMNRERLRMHQTCSFFVWKLHLMKHDSEPVDPPARLLLPTVSSLVSWGAVTRQVMASSNSWRGSKGHVTAASGPISIPERLRVVWYWITLIRPLPFSQRHLHCNLTFVVGEPTFFFFLLQAPREATITGGKVNPLWLHLLYLKQTCWHWM